MSAGTDGRTAIIVVAWNHRRYLADCLRAVGESGIAPGTAELILVDNASSDGTAEFVRTELLSADGRATRQGFPIRFLANAENLGFSGGNNQAIRLAIESGAEFVYLLNPDTEAQPGFLAKALEAMRDPQVGVVQSLLRLHPRTELVNSWGNEIHYLGFGYAGGESVPLASEEARRKIVPREIAYASGAGMLVRASLIEEIGGLDESLFAYHEDLEFSWRARLAGRKVVLAPESVVDHKYEFSRSIAKYYWMERNRYLVALRMYRWPTLFLLVPAFLAMEIGLWLFALKGGWWREKARAVHDALKPSRWRETLEARRRIARLRKVSDREATRLFTGKILFQQMKPGLLTLVANPVFAAYWRLARLFLVW